MVTVNEGLHDVQNTRRDFGWLGAFLCSQGGRERSYSRFSLWYCYGYC